LRSIIHRQHAKNAKKNGGRASKACLFFALFAPLRLITKTIHRQDAKNAKKNRSYAAKARLLCAFRG
jgi:hypothetical protein